MGMMRYAVSYFRPRRALFQCVIAIAAISPLAYGVDLELQGSHPGSPTGFMSWLVLAQNPVVFDTTLCKFRVRIVSASSSPLRDEAVTERPDGACNVRLRMDGYEYPLSQNMDYYGNALVTRAPSSVTQCRRASGQIPTSTGPLILALNTSIIGATHSSLSWRQVGEVVRVTIRSIDGDVVCAGGVSVPDRIFRDAFDGAQIFRSGFDR